MKPTRRKIPKTGERLSLALAAVLVLIIGLAAFRTWQEFGRHSEQLEITQGIMSRTNGLLSSLKDAETGQRGFLLTGEERYLEPYQQALRDVPATIDGLLTIAGSHPDQARALNQLWPLVKEKLDELRTTIEVRRTQGADAALAIVRTDRGKAAMDRIRAICADVQSVSNQRLREYSAAARVSADELGLISTVGAVGLLIMLTLATATIQRATRRREELIDELDESRDRLQTTLTSIGDAVITTDGEGKVSLLNPVAQELTEWPQEEAEGRPLEEVFIIRNADSGAEVESPVRKVLREGKVVGLANHTVLIGKHGRKTHIDDSAAPIRNADEIAGVVLVFRDITERRRAEEALRESNIALSRANEDLKQFAFAASHDLQEPLRMITAYSQLLIKGFSGQLAGEAAVCIDFITQGTKRMRELLGDLLAYTQITGETELPTGLVDLNEAVALAVDNCSVAIGETAASVTSEGLPVVVGYKPHFVQLFQNLISNGIKYRSEQPPRVHVSAEKDDGYWRIAVKDNGIGIAPQYQEQIFGVFKRLHGRSIPGTGIGLAICKRVVDRFGGRIWVESEAGEGATFYFTIPG